MIYHKIEINLLLVSHPPGTLPKSCFSASKMISMRSRDQMSDLSFCSFLLPAPAVSKTSKKKTIKCNNSDPLGVNKSNIDY